MIKEEHFHKFYHEIVRTSFSVTLMTISLGLNPFNADICIENADICISMKISEFRCRYRCKIQLFLFKIHISVIKS